MANRTVITIGVRELKAKTSEVLRRLEEDKDLEIIITRHGKPCARLLPLRSKGLTLGKELTKVPPSERVSLRGTWSHLQWDREPTDEDFEEAKRIWEPRLDILDG